MSRWLRVSWALIIESIAEDDGVDVTGRLVDTISAPATVDFAAPAALPLEAMEV